VNATVENPNSKVAIEDQVKSILANVLNAEVASHDTDLVETGMLDSLALVSFILELETSFNLSVSYDNLEIDNFRTVKTISEFVRQTMNQ
jgi:acyl carrier protein